MITQFTAKNDSNVSKEFRVFPFKTYYVTMGITFLILPGIIKATLLKDVHSSFLGLLLVAVGVILFGFVFYYENQQKKDMNPFLDDLNEQIRKNYNNIRSDDIKNIVFAESIPIMFVSTFIACITFALGLCLLML